MEYGHPKHLENLVGRQEAREELANLLTPPVTEVGSWEIPADASSTDLETSASLDETWIAA